MQLNINKEVFQIST